LVFLVVCIFGCMMSVAFGLRMYTSNHPLEGEGVTEVTPY